ncbi:MAG: 30S ribosomal protein S3 [Vampirovibrio sp.]
MGQKVHPRGLRLGIIEDWQSSWYVKSSLEFAKYIKEDEVIRRFITKKLKAAALSSVMIQRKSEKILISIVTGRSGVVIGRGGQNLDLLRTELLTLVSTKDLRLEVLEVDKVDADAELVAQSIAQQLERRVAFRRATKQAIQKAMRAGAKGIKVMVSGRLAGADIARSEWAKEGRIPLHTFKAGIQYAHAEAHTLFGVIGVKVWIYVGDCDTKVLTYHNIRTAGSKPQQNASDRDGQRRKSTRRPQRNAK